MNGWQYLKKAMKSKIFDDEYEKRLYCEMRKKKRTSKMSMEDLSNEISRCLIKRPSLILNEENILDFNRNIFQSIQFNTNSTDEFDLSDFEGKIGLNARGFRRGPESIYYLNLIFLKFLFNFPQSLFFPSLYLSTSKSSFL